jgi:hypothetical protein
MIKLKKLIQEKVIIKRNYKGGKEKIPFSNIEMQILKQRKTENVAKNEVRYMWDDGYGEEEYELVITKEPYYKDKKSSVYVSYATEWAEGSNMTYINKKYSAMSEPFKFSNPKILEQFLKELDIGMW